MRNPCLGYLALLCLCACTGGGDREATADPPPPSTTDEATADTGLTTLTDTATPGSGSTGGPTGATGQTGDTSPTGDTGIDCDNPVEFTFPADGEGDAFYRGVVLAHLETPDATATLTVAGVSGTSTVSDAYAVFEVDGAYTMGATYDATLTHACGIERWSFAISDVGQPTSTSPSGSVYRVVPSMGFMAKPTDVMADLLTDLLDSSEVLLGITATPTLGIEMITAVGDGTGAQDPCFPTQELDASASTYDDPFFSVEGSQLIISSSVYPFDIQPYGLSGAFASDLSAIHGVELQGSIDSRTLKGALGLGEDAPDETPCGVFKAVGWECTECPDGSGHFCFDFWVTDLEADLVAGPILPVSEADAALQCP